MTQRLDITGDVCPMTFVKVKIALAKLPPGASLEVRLKEEALKNVVSSLKQEGHRVTGVNRDEGAFRIVVERGGKGA
ncbi:MAG: sulfurtransferase TusA family protein [Deltaproteobacteria bacterium]